MKDFRKLSVWEKSHRFTIDIYELTEGFPKSELYGLTSQIRRAASSIPTNIAEGCGRGSDKVQEIKKMVVSLIKTLRG